MDENKRLLPVFEEIEGGYFDIDIIDYDETVSEGDEIAVEYIVENRGDKEGT